jgi:hypothetical protein
MTHNLGRISCWALAALAICCGLIVVTLCSAYAPPNSCLSINSSGHRIPTVFWGLRPHPEFAKALGREVVSLRGQKSVPRFENLVSHVVCPKSLLRNVGFPQDSGYCYGQYMVATLWNCCVTLPCNSAPPYDYDVFNSTGDQQCSGYQILGDACNGCELDEQGCASCFAGP